MTTDQPASLTPEIVSAILRDPDSPFFPTQITVFCDHCGRERTGDYMVRDDMTSEQRLAVARKHLVDNEGWEHSQDGDDFCPEHAGSPDEEPREPCGESCCLCCGVGPEHADCACGCDCPRCDECHQLEEHCDC